MKLSQDSFTDMEAPCASFFVSGSPLARAGHLATMATRTLPYSHIRPRLVHPENVISNIDSF